MYFNYTKECIFVFHGVNFYANLPQRYVIRTFLTLVSRTFIINVTFFLFLIEDIRCLNSTSKTKCFKVTVKTQQQCLNTLYKYIQSTDFTSCL